jgi:hypothetical protein
LEKNHVHANNLASFHKYNSTFILIITKLPSIVCWPWVL